MSLDWSEYHQRKDVSSGGGGATAASRGGTRCSIFSSAPVGKKGKRKRDQDSSYAGKSGSAGLGLGF